MFEKKDFPFAAQSPLSPLPTKGGGPKDTKTKPGNAPPRTKPKPK